MTVEEWKRKNPPIQRKPITNADHIRAMTDEELAGLISRYIDCDLCPVRKMDENGWCRTHFCGMEIQKWLKEEVNNNGRTITRRSRCSG